MQRLLLLLNKFNFYSVNILTILTTTQFFCLQSSSSVCKCANTHTHTGMYILVSFMLDLISHFIQSYHTHTLIQELTTEVVQRWATKAYTIKKIRLVRYIYEWSLYHHPNNYITNNMQLTKSSDYEIVRLWLQSRQ